MHAVSQKQMNQIDAEFQDLSKDGGISRNKFVAAFTGAGLGAEFAGILFDSFDVDGNKYVFRRLKVHEGGGGVAKKDHQRTSFFEARLRGHIFSATLAPRFSSGPTVSRFP